MIREAKGYPKKPEYITIEVPKNAKLEKEIKRLVDEGYLTNKVRDRIDNGMHTFFHEATDKGKNLVLNVMWIDEGAKFRHMLQPRFIFAPYTHKLDIKRITEILIDSDNKAALVKYEVAYIKTDYYHKLIEIDKEKVENSSKKENSFVKKKQIRLKKWDQGWRVME